MCGDLHEDQLVCFNPMEGSKAPYVNVSGPLSGSSCHHHLSGATVVSPELKESDIRSREIPSPKDSVFLADMRAPFAMA